MDTVHIDVSLCEWAEVWLTKQYVIGHTDCQVHTVQMTKQ